MSVAGPFSNVLRELSQAGVRFVVVGGVAAVMQGVERVTYDLDLVIELTRESCLAAIDRLLAIGYQARVPVDPRGFADPALRESWIRDKGMRVFSFWDTTGQRAQVDVFVRYPLAFEALWRDATHVSLDGVDLRLASPAHLVRMKREAGRPKDIEDIRALGFDPEAADVDEP